MQLWFLRDLLPTLTFQVQRGLPKIALQTFLLHPSSLELLLVPRLDTSTGSTTICPTAVLPTKQIMLSATSSLRTVHLENPVRLCRAVRELPNLASLEHLFAAGMYILTQFSNLAPTYPVRDS